MTCAPPSGSVLAIGVTPLACSAIDHVGNSAAGSFTVTVLGAKAQLLALIDEVVTASRLPDALRSQLIGRLSALVADFDPANAMQRRAVCLSLQGFVAVVQRLAGVLIPASQAAEWVADATRIRAVLAC